MPGDRPQNRPTMKSQTPSSEREPSTKQPGPDRSAPTCSLLFICSWGLIVVLLSAASVMNSLALIRLRREVAELQAIQTTQPGQQQSLPRQSPKTPESSSNGASQALPTGHAVLYAARPHRLLLSHEEYSNAQISPHRPSNFPDAAMPFARET